MCPNKVIQTASLKGVTAVYPSQDHLTPTWRYRINLLLFCIASVLISLWFYLHLRTLVTEILVVSGPLTLWGLWKLIEPVVTANVDRKDLTRKLLAHDNATQYLAFVAAVAVFALLVTSSVYVVYGANAGVKSVTLHVDEQRPGPDGKPIAKRLIATQTLDAQHSAVGQLFWPRGPRKLIVHVTDPPGKKPREEEMGWFPSAIHLELLDREKFLNVDYRIIRLAPVTDLPIADDTASDYTLQVLRDKEELAKVTGAHLRTYAFGLAEDELSLLLPANDSSYQAAIERFFESPETGDSTAVRNSLLRKPVRVGTAALKEKDLLTVVLTKSADGKEKWRHTAPLTVGSASVQTCFMEVIDDALSLGCE